MSMITFFVKRFIITNRSAGIITSLFMSYIAFFCMAEENAGTENKNLSNDPITCQLKVLTNKIDYRKSVDFYVTLTNRGRIPREFVPSQLGELSDPSLLSFQVEQKDLSDVMVDCLGCKQPSVVLLPKQSVTIKAPGRLFAPGKHTVMARYYIEMRYPAQTLPLYSNPVEFEIIDRPLNDQEAATLRKEYQDLGKQYEKAISNKDINADHPLVDDTNRIFCDIFVVGSPYSVPALMDLMENSSYPYVRYRATKILGIIAGKNGVFHRDISAFDLFLKRLTNEPVGRVRSSIVFNLYLFMDALSPQQRGNCRKNLLEQLKKDDGGSIFAISLILVDHFPHDADLIKSCLEKNEILTKEQKEMIIEKLNGQK
jgi:hypothetical protein